MTLLSICIAAADEIGIDRPSSVIGNPSPTAQKLLRYANKVGKRLMKGYAWEVLRKEVTFTSVGSETQTGILPSDFDRFVAETFWNRSTETLVSGPVSPVQWQGLKALGYSGDPKFALRGGNVLILPQLSAGATLAFEYVSNLWCQSSGGTGQTAWAADTDVGVLDEELLTLALKFTYLTDEGLPNAQAAEEFTDYLNTLLDNDQPNAGILVAADIFGGQRHFTGAPAVGRSVYPL